MWFTLHSAAVAKIFCNSGLNIKPVSVLVRWWKTLKGLPLYEKRALLPRGLTSRKVVQSSSQRCCCYSLLRCLNFADISLGYDYNCILIYECNCCLHPNFLIFRYQLCPFGFYRCVMPLIENYASPTPEDLTLLKSSLGLTGTQMAKFAGLAGSNHWRKYTGGELPRVMGMHMMFFGRSFSFKWKRIK